MTELEQKILRPAGAILVLALACAAILAFNGGVAVVTEFLIFLSVSAWFSYDILRSLLRSLQDALLVAERLQRDNQKLRAYAKTTGPYRLPKKCQGYFRIQVAGELIENRD